MTSDEFLSLLSKEVSGYKSILETGENEWIIKGLIDIRKTIYPMSDDTKLVSKVAEIILFPQLLLFAKQNGLEVEIQDKQNQYPDLTFKDRENHLFAVDIKSSYYRKNGMVNGLTLGSYWGYFRKRSERSSVSYPYGMYSAHIVLGILYKRTSQRRIDLRTYSIDELAGIRSVVRDFIFFVQPKWKIASDIPGSGNTRNIGGVKTVSQLVEGSGPFVSFGENGETVFDHYWMHYFNARDAKDAGYEGPLYTDLDSYRKYLETQQQHLKLISECQ